MSATSLAWHRAVPSLLSPSTISRAATATSALLRQRCAYCIRPQAVPRPSSRYLQTASFKPYTLPNTTSPSPPPPRNANAPEPSLAGKSDNALSEARTELPQIASVPSVDSVKTLDPGTATPPPRRRKLRPRKAAMSLSQAAVSQLRTMLDSPTPQLIRIGVKNRGCSGLAYHLEYVDKPGAFDETVEQDGVRVLIDSKALFSIIGSEMDWIEDRLEERFVFKNPNITEQCGCGESFSIS